MRFLKFSLLAVLIFFGVSLSAQQIVGLSTDWSDSFSEWTIITEDEDITGELRLKWPLEQDWSEWIFFLEDEIGHIKMTWKDNPNQWELRSQGQIITIRTVWKDDPTRWRITDNTHSFTVVSKWRNLPYEWKLQETNWGDFEIYMSNEPDPRDWEVFDTLTDEVSLPIKMAMFFITVYHSIPKF